MVSLKSLIIEGRYDSLVTALSRQLLSVVKDSYSAVTDPDGKFSGQKIYFTSDEPVPNIDDDAQFKHVYFQEVENEQIPLEFYLELKVMWVQGLDDFKYGGDAYNETKLHGETPPLIEVRFTIDPADYPTILSEIATHLRDVLRHEIEHITQSGWNLKSGKYIASDQALRKKIETGEKPPVHYFLLPKEITAMIHGLYTKAKKSKQPFKSIVNDYLDIWVANDAITDKDKETILTTWRTYLPKLSIRQEL
jgi:hypothetical protein